MPEWLRLLWGTVLLRPYVFSFLLVYLVAAGYHLGWRKTSAYVPIGYGLAWVSEFSSIHWGFPYGDYYYIPATVGRELWVAPAMHGEVQHLRLYDRALRTSEAVGNFHALLH